MGDRLPLPGFNEGMVPDEVKMVDQERAYEQLKKVGGGEGLMVEEFRLIDGEWQVKTSARLSHTTLMSANGVLEVRWTDPSLPSNAGGMKFFRVDEPRVLLIQQTSIDGGRQGVTLLGPGGRRVRFSSETEE